MDPSQTWHSHGKLMLTGEYLVLDGALSLAFPSVAGQTLTVTGSDKPGTLEWTALDHRGVSWFETTFLLRGGVIESGDGSPESELLKNLLNEALRLVPGFLNENTGYRVMTRLEFPRQWGLGSSSTLVANLAKWSGADALELFSGSMKGSGYDVAVAMSGKPVLYQLTDSRPVWETAELVLPFRDQLYFVYSGNKQNSAREIINYKSRSADVSAACETVSEITKAIIDCESLEDFEELITVHEYILGDVMERPVLKEAEFPDFPGAVKSLGAWGGDFFLATGPEAIPYFTQKGFADIFPWKDILL